MIDVSKLTKNYNGFQALNSISFSIKANEIVGIIGPNGAGKSTTLRILTGYLAKDEGSVSIDNIDPQTNNLELKKNIGYLPERSPIYPEMTPFEFLLFIANLRQLNEIEKALHWVKSCCFLEDVWNKPMKQLSKGYRHRVSFAQAILHKPKLLILDEPMDSLDPIQREESKNLILEMRENRTIIICTHNLEDLPKICDRVLMLHKGHLVMDSPMDELKKQGKLIDIFKKKVESFHD